MKYLALFLAVFGCVSCASHPEPSSSPAEQSANFNSTLWMQTAAEYQASALQAYQSATSHLDEAIADHHWLAAIEQADGQELDLAPAIIMDVDETILDNSPYQAQRVLDGDQYAPETWDNWVRAARAEAVPGAVDFINAAQDKGVRVFFLTNRSCSIRKGSTARCPQLSDTMANLRAVGINNVSVEQLLLKNQQPDWSSEKQSRREAVAQLYRIIMLVGDDLGDFLPNVKMDITVDQRQQLVQHYHDYWGSKWIILPNPTYGSWQRVLGDEARTFLHGTDVE